MNHLATNQSNLGIYAKAAQAIKVSETNLNDIEKIVVNSYVFLGMTKYTTEDVKFMAQLIKSEVEQYFRKLTIEELKLAIHKGIRGEYEHLIGQTIGFSLINVHKYLGAFIKDEKRREQLEAMEVKPTKPEPDESELKQMEADYWEQTIRQIERYQKYDEWSILLPSLLFDKLIKRGLINPTAEDKRKAMDEATAQIAEAMLSLPFNLRGEIKSVLTKIGEGEKPLRQINLAKEIILKDCLRFIDVEILKL